MQAMEIVVVHGLMGWKNNDNPISSEAKEWLGKNFIYTSFSFLETVVDVWISSFGFSGNDDIFYVRNGEKGKITAQRDCVRGVYVFFSYTR